MEEAISAASVANTGTTWEPETAEYYMALAESTNNNMMPSLADFSTVSPPMDENNTTLPNQRLNDSQLITLVQTFTGDSELDTYETLEHQPEQMNDMINAFDLSWLGLDQSAIDNNETLNQQKDSHPIEPIPEATWVPNTMTNLNIIQTNNYQEQPVFAQILNTTQYLLTNQLVQINRIVPVTNPTWLPEVANTDPPVVNQGDLINATTPTVESSWVDYGSQPLLDINQAGSQWGVVDMVPLDQVTANQIQENDVTTPTENTLDADWVVHPYIQASLNNLNYFPDSQVSCQQPVENSVENIVSYPSPIATVEEVQHLCHVENATIAIPLITDPNVPPELITFRPGVYEGDEIPPVYSDLSIIAAPNDYKPMLPPPVYPEISIFPEPILEEHLVTESINQRYVENTVHQINIQEILPSEVVNDVNVNENESYPQTARDNVKEEVLTTPSESLSTTNSSPRTIDVTWLTTQRDSKLILIHKDFHYRRYSCRGTKTRWRCVSPSCEAFLYTVETKVTKTHLVHNHHKILSVKPVSVKETNPDSAVLLKDANSVEGADLSLNGDHANTGEDNMILTQDHSIQPNTEYEEPTPAIASADSNNVFGSRAVFTIIPHDPSLEITVKSPALFNESPSELNNNTNSMTSFPDPLGICVTSYTPPASYNDSAIKSCRCYNSCFPANIHMTVPSDTKVKVTLTTKPRKSKARIYHDGKLVQISTKRKKPTNTLHSSKVAATSTSQDTMVRNTHMPTPSIILRRVITSNSDSDTNPVYTCIQNTNTPSMVTASTDTPICCNIQNSNLPNDDVFPVNLFVNIQTSALSSSTSNTLPVTNTTSNVHADTTSTASRPLINIPWSQIVTNSNSWNSQPHTMSPTQTSDQVSQGLPKTPNNMSLATTSTVTSGTSSQTLNLIASTSTAMSTVQPREPNSSFRTINPHITITRPSLRRTMIPTGYAQKRPARARNEQNKRRKSHDF